MSLSDQTTVPDRSGLARYRRFVLGKAIVLVETTRKEITVNGGLLDLTEKAAEAVMTMMQDPTRPWTREEIMDALYPGEKPGLAGIDVLFDSVERACEYAHPDAGEFIIRTWEGNYKVNAREA